MADVLSLKWIEGNDVVTLSGGTYTTPIDVHISGNTANTPTFDVDNPVMWTPLSVLSGLASGYCERRAVLNPIFVTGTTVNESSVIVNLEKDWYTGGSDVRDEISRNFMHNLAVGSSGDTNMYQSATNATMHMFGSAGASNYMTAMDSAITALVSGATTYRTSTGGAFGDLSVPAFSALASAASATAAETSYTSSAPISSVSQPVSNGGQFNARMAIGIPVEWAKERKWMLDELRWTTGQPTKDALNNTWNGKLLDLSATPVVDDQDMLMYTSYGSYNRAPSADIYGKYAWSKGTGTGEPIVYTEDRFPSPGNGVYIHVPIPSTGNNNNFEDSLFWESNGVFKFLQYSEDDGTMYPYTSTYNEPLDRTTYTFTYRVYGEDDSYTTGTSTYVNNYPWYDYSSLTRLTATVGGLQEIREEAATTAQTVTSSALDWEAGAEHFNMHIRGLASCTVTPATWANDVYASALTKTVELVSSSVTIADSSGDTYTTPSYYVTYMSSGTDALDNDYHMVDYMTNIATPVSRIDIACPELSSSTVAVELFLDRPGDWTNTTLPFYSSYIDQNSYLVSAADTIDAEKAVNINSGYGTLIVLSGGTATLSNCSLQRAIVEPQGSLVIGSESNTSVNQCCVLTKEESIENVTIRTGGIVIGAYKDGTGADAIKSAYENFKRIYTGNTTSTVHIKDSTVTYTTAPDTDAIVIESGGTCIISKTELTQDIRVLSGGSLIVRATSASGTTLNGEVNVLYGGYALASGTNFWLEDLSIYSGGTGCFINNVLDGSYTAGIRNAWLQSGSLITVNSTCLLVYHTGAWNNEGWLYVEDGAVARVISTTATTATASNILNTPRAIYSYKAKTSTPCNVNYRRFSNNGLVFSGTQTPLHAGWNSCTISAITGQTVATFASSGLAATVVEPITEPLFTGQYQYRFTIFPTELQQGFLIKSVRVIRPRDHYPEFYVRQFPTQAEIDQATSSATTT